MNEYNLCPKLEYAFQLLGKRWNGLIIATLLSGPKRFKDISNTILPMSDKMLAERMRELEAEQIVKRNVYPEKPVRIEYELTEKGADLAPVLDAMETWAETWNICKN
ncbi:transcriptional regulator, HxlR family [Seinonella peptonophila]|uniref:Transcriptional regulator, HxlR family n=1 Tax=Seinonella peptonophila TaxID=112248 RepID=A0A1M4TBT5_9BACL|nr:helix-turn-helix domain-containing protein [Seinonella peptonophila]SHE42009.1 transcriptional regulator, HxlR family [Seinonella peptonophila]